MKYAFVTGGNRGLGKGFVEYLSSNGYTVFCGYRNSKLETLNPNIINIHLDVLDDSSIDMAFNTISNYTRHLDLLVNNAGVSKDTVVVNNKQLSNNLDTLDRETILKMFNINSISPLMIIKRFKPLLINSKSSFIINISSARASFKDEWGYEIANYGYRGSKAALNIMTRSLLVELPKNVKTFSVDPGDVNTDMNDEGEVDIVEAAKRIIRIVDNWRDEFNGEFMRWSGEIYPK